MYTNDEIVDRIFIITHSDLGDVKILDENYRLLINESFNPEEKQQLLSLKKTAITRISILEKDA